jgi:protein-S-isoprenylcysteine O-methyltransferase Ste14
LDRHYFPGVPAWESNTGQHPGTIASITTKKYVRNGTTCMKRSVYRLVCNGIFGALAYEATSLGPGIRFFIAIIIGLPSCVLMIVARRELGKSFSIAAVAKALVTNGLYSKIQHPMYLFLDLFLLAFIIFVNGSILLPFWAVLVLVQTFQSRREEKTLAAAFGHEYEAYEAGTWL